MEDNQKVFVEMGLTVDQTEILYNFHALNVGYDIGTEDNPEKKKKKNEWLNEWKDSISQAFPEIAKNDKRKIKWMTQQELRDTINREMKKTDNELWYHLVVMEAALFIAYTPLEYEKVEGKNGKEKIVYSKKYKGLKQRKDADWVADFVASDTHIKDGFTKTVKETYRKTFDRISGKNKAIFGGIVMLIATALSAGLAYAFAPVIAIAIFGGPFAALKGAALVSATLAYIGGGAIAVGGGGMVAGIATIVGGGALLGAAVGGAALGGINSFGLFSNLVNVLSQAAKLEVTFKVVALMHLKNVELAKKILRDLNNEIIAYKAKQSELAKKPENESKDDAKARKAELSHVKKCIKILSNVQNEMDLFMLARV